jgi:hypothetical protein
MENNQLEIVGALLMAAVTFPLSFYLARLCLRGVVRLVTSAEQRSLR